MTDDDIIYGPLPLSTPVPPLRVSHLSGTFSCITKQSELDIHMSHIAKYLDSKRPDMAQSLWESLMQHPTDSAGYCIQLPHLIRLDASETFLHHRDHMRIIQASENDYIDLSLYPPGEYTGKVCLKLTDAVMKWNELDHTHEIHPKRADRLYQIELSLEELRCIRASKYSPEEPTQHQIDLRKTWREFKNMFQKAWNG